MRKSNFIQILKNVPFVLKLVPVVLDKIPLFSYILLFIYPIQSNIVHHNFGGQQP